MLSRQRILKIIREELSFVLKILKEQEDTYSEKKERIHCLKNCGLILEGRQWKDLQKKNKFTKQKAGSIFLSGKFRNQNEHR